MNTAFVVFGGMTALDFIGAYDPLTRLKSMQIIPNLQWDICAVAEEVADDKGMSFAPSVVAKPLSDHDLDVVPGGFGTRTHQHDKDFVDWLRTSEPVTLKASVCTGSLLLGAAGFLKGKRATTHPSAFEELKPYCAQVVDERVVDEGEIVTARSVLGRTARGRGRAQAGGEANGLPLCMAGCNHTECHGCARSTATPEGATRFLARVIADGRPTRPGDRA